MTVCDRSPGNRSPGSSGQPHRVRKNREASEFRNGAQGLLVEDVAASS